MLKDIPAGSVRRGDLRRADKVMSAEEVRAFLGDAHCGRTATVGADGYPYVVPNLFVWMEERIFLHTARVRGHFLANIEFCDRVCFEADQPGEIFPYGPVECDTSIAFRSVVVFGRIRVVPELDIRERFFAAFMSKYAPRDSWGRARGSFPRIDATILYAITPEILTGKQTPLPAAGKLWRRTDAPAGTSS
ncbi:MAG TPA: pyridoxamine 5'-phosphate oxidase family protein [Steroidobacteraceae bacterium]|nr:pyridoxamine 5'-phosphate oxidase family protein [Steroidobacteraceae bacterium]